MPILERNLVTNIILYWQLSLSNIKAHCWSTSLFLSNSGNLRSLSVTTKYVSSFPANVFDRLGDFSFLGMIPYDSADLLVKHAFEPESSNTLNILQLLNSQLYLLYR